MGVDVVTKRVIWLKARPDFDVLFQLFNNLCLDEQRRFWIVYPDEYENICGAGEGLRQMATEVKITLPMSHNFLTEPKEQVKQQYCTLKVRSPSCH